METNELLLHLIKKLESGEITFDIGGYANEAYLKDNVSKQEIRVGEWEIEKETPIEIGYKKGSNEIFLNNFYKEKGVKCWVKGCSNKILQTEGDHKKVKVPCKDAHTRLVCNSCSENIK